MKEMTKAQIQERQLAIWNRIDELDEAGKTRELTAEEVKEQRELVDESAKLSTRAKALASGAELAAIKSREDKGKELREMIADCFTHKRAANATTILANAITSGPDQNEKANLEAGGLIPVEIRPIIDTKNVEIQRQDDTSRDHRPRQRSPSNFIDTANEQDPPLREVPLILLHQLQLFSQQLLTLRLLHNDLQNTPDVPFGDRSY